MKLVMTLLARDEADIVDAQIAFHLQAGVDFVIATDNRSRDGTTEIFRRYERAGVLHLIREEGEDMPQSAWVTRMARLAATDFGADWVINSDADEFWWPRGGSLKDVLAAVPSRFGVVRGGWRHFVPRPDDGGFFAERMIVRLRALAHPGDKRTIYHAHQKVAHRAEPDVLVEPGNHDALGAALEPLRGWLPIEVLHFSFRSPSQMASKARGGWYSTPDATTLHQDLLRNAWEEDRVEEHWREFLVEDDALEEGLRAGKYAIDTRLRDALRALRGSDGSFDIPRGGGLSFPRPSVHHDAIFADEVAPLASIDGIVRAQERAAALEERLERLEREPLTRLRRLARR